MINPLQFLKEVRSELTKVVWPSRKDIIKLTIAVILLSLAVAAFLGLVDYGLTSGLQKLINNR
ncbi:MAG: preprotein translocase subunit SecE [Acidobacteriaceae bacterium]